MPTTITIESQQSPTDSSSQSGSRANSFTDEEGSSGTGVHVRSHVGSHNYSDPIDETWEVYSDEIEPSESASHPRTSTQRYRTEPRRPASTSRVPTRRHTTSDRVPRHPAVSRVHRHPAPAPPSIVDPNEDYPGYGRGYPAPPPQPYGGRAPPPGYAPSSYSGSGGYAPPFGAAPGALTHYGAPATYQYPPGNPFSPQPAHPGPGGGYFGAPHHPISGHSTPGGYPGHELMAQYPPHAPYGYPGYMPPPMPPGIPPGMPPHHMQYYPQWPPSDHGSAPDPEMEKKLLAIEELMKNQKIDFEKAQAELASRDAKEIADKKAAAVAVEAAKKAAEAAAEASKRAAEEKAAWEKKLEEEKEAALAKGKEEAKKLQDAEKKAAEAAAEAAKKAAEEKAAWEKKLEEEKKAAMAKGREEAKKQQEADKTKAEEKAAEEKAKADAIAALEKAKADATEALEKAKADAAAELEKIKKENAEALAKALEKPKDEAKKPIKFKDAVGRKFSFPFHLCATWQGMEELIRQAFVHVDVIGLLVAEGHYDLIGPNGEIILPQVWETMIEPDWSVTMVMWPVQEQPKLPPGMPIGAMPHPMDRPRGGHRHGHRSMPPMPPATSHRGGPPPPPPPNWPGGARPGGAPHVGPGPGGPSIVVMPPSGGPKKKKKEESKGVLGFLSGKQAKPAGKGPKKAEQNDACRLM